MIRPVAKLIGPFFWLSYRVGSANFLWLNMGHVHGSTADSENVHVAGEREPNVPVHFIFRFENGQGNQSFFLSMTKIQLKRVNDKLSRRTIDAPSTGRFCEASSGPEKNLVQHGLVEKEENFVDSRKLLFRARSHCIKIVRYCIETLRRIVCITIILLFFLVSAMVILHPVWWGT